MSQAEINRIREDLETIREAAGMGLPFGWEDVWLNLAGVPCGLIVFAAGVFGAPECRTLMTMPALGALVAAVGLAEQRAQIIEHLAGAMAVAHHALQGEPRLVEVRRIMAEKAPRRAAVQRS